MLLRPRVLLAGAVLLSTTGLGAVAAAPSWAASATPSAVQPSATPAPTVIAVPAPTPSSAPVGIDVPAGNAYRPAPNHHGLEIGGLLAAGCALAGGGTVLAGRRRA